MMSRLVSHLLSTLYFVQYHVEILLHRIMISLVYDTTELHHPVCLMSMWNYFCIWWSDMLEGGKTATLCKATKWTWFVCPAMYFPIKYHYVVICSKWKKCLLTFSDKLWFHIVFIISETEVWRILHFNCIYTLFCVLYYAWLNGKRRCCHYLTFIKQWVKIICFGTCHFITW